MAHSYNLNISTKTIRAEIVGEVVLFCLIFLCSGLDQKHLSFSKLRSLLIWHFSTWALLFPTHRAFDLRECVKRSPQLVNLSCSIEEQKKKKKKVTPARTDSATHGAAQSERQQKHTLTHIGFAQAWSSAPVSMVVQ